MIDKKEKLKTRHLAERLVRDIDLESVFKEEPKADNKKDPYELND